MLGEFRIRAGDASSCIHILATVLVFSMATVGPLSSKATAQIQTSVGNTASNCSCGIHHPRKKPQKMTGSSKSDKSVESTPQNGPPTRPTDETTMPAPLSILAVPPWEQTVIKAVVEGGISLVSLAFAAFTFLHGTLLGLRDEDPSDGRVRVLKRRLVSATYATAIAIGASTILTMLAFFALVTENKAISAVTVGLAVVILVGLSAIALYLAYDIYEERHSLI